jgi:subfamily B ATP-binding cassette protein MsbA
MMAQAEAARSHRGDSGLFDNLAVDHGRSWPVIVRLIRETLLPNWKRVLLIFAAIVALAISGGALPFLLQRVADDVFVGKDPGLLLILPALVVSVMVLRAAADWVSAVAESSLGTKIVADLRLRMFDTIAAADLGWLQRTHSGRFVSAFVNDTAIVDRAGARVLTTIVKQSLSVLVLVGAMIYMDWVLSAIVLAGLPVVAVHLGRQRRRIRQSVRRSLQESGDLGSMLTQTIQSIRVVKAYGQEGSEAARFRQIVNNVRKYLMRTSRSRAAVGPVSEAMSGVGIAAAILYGGWQGIYGDLSLGHFMGFMAAAMLAFQPLRALVNAQAVLSEGVLAASRVFALIDRAPLVATSPGHGPAGHRGRHQPPQR